MTIGECFPSSARWMNAGPFQPLVDVFVAGLQSRRHTILTIRNYENSARHFADWLCRRTCRSALRKAPMPVSGDPAEGRRFPQVCAPRSTVHPVPRGPRRAHGDGTSRCTKSRSTDRRLSGLASASSRNLRAHDRSPRAYDRAIASEPWHRSRDLRRRADPQCNH
jgi:hypothetical protein